MCGLGNRKNAFFSAVLSDEGVEPYPGSIQLLDELAERGTKVAVVSSRRTHPRCWKPPGSPTGSRWSSTGMSRPSAHLPGKPSPDTFVDAAAQLGVPIERAVVFEDAVSGVEAGRAGNFGLVIGVDRGVGAIGCGSPAPTSSSPIWLSWSRS